MSEPGAIRDLEQIQEADASQRPTGLVTALLVGAGGACIAFAALALRPDAEHKPQPPDPLAQLAAKSGDKGAAKAKNEALEPDDVTFPDLLSDRDEPTTALAALSKNAEGSDTDAPAPAAATSAEPPPPTDRLSVVPLPAQTMLAASPVITRPRDPLTKRASTARSKDEATPASPAGRPGGYQLQVSSFRGEEEADAFAAHLRQRGHKAHVVRADVAGRGTWFRVQVGPFKTKASALDYRGKFEAGERVVPFIVVPESPPAGATGSKKSAAEDKPKAAH